ncbi:phage distal tail protein, Rcc01695 family [Rickettsia endosymbiont of Halotydeus destructor]|uniref:phage distal tail protein, Rcc01695 family n=1 Tax=Rickettsia endosymbiont of Halotydeus destructor TaxID=2996754 RepID=UPI003BAEF80C
MNFHNIRMPEFIEVCAVGKAEFSTSHALTMSGREVRHLDCAHACQKYLIKNCFLSNNEFNQFNSFFKARRGSNFSFRFRDYADYKVTGEFIAKGDGSQKQFYLSKLYDDPIFPYNRAITKPVEDSIVLYINNVKTDYAVDYNQGIITLPKALEQEQILTADFMFDVAVRFKGDSFEYTYCSDGSIALSDLELTEVIV